MRKALTPVRGCQERPLVARWVLAHYSGRNAATVARRCTAVACDVRNRSLLYDITESLALLARLRGPGR